MKYVVTVMVRDEVDVIAAMIEHSLDQKPDLIIATDNGSVDGTTEVLQRYADLGLVELHHDPVHRKQQHAVVTAMARRARTEFGADWVVNADADEFWVPIDKSLTLRTALEQTPLALNAFTVPVTNLVGRPARRGTGLDRLVWRDHRTDAQLQAIGINAQPTANAVHRGEPDVVVAQGNHFVSIPSNGQPPTEVGLEVLHLPWRSWSQFERKVVHAGRGYEASPDLRPSPKHHGMKDYRRFLAGRLEPAYLLRQPTPAELSAGEADGSFVHDPWLRDHLHALQRRAVCPDLLAPLLDGSADEPFDEPHLEASAALGRQFHTLETERDEALTLADAHLAKARRLARERDEVRTKLKKASASRPVPVEAAALARRVARSAGRRLRLR